MLSQVEWRSDESIKRDVGYDFVEVFAMWLCAESVEEEAFSEDSRAVGI